jgi:hypothetical protein
MNRYPLEELCTHKFGLADVNSALMTVAEKAKKVLSIAPLIPGISNLTMPNIPCIFLA